MNHAPRRGDIMRCAGLHFVAWADIPEPAGFVLHAQRAPLHRAQVPLRRDDLPALALKGDAWVIDVRTVRIIPDEAVLHALCPWRLVARIEATVMRALAADRSEASWPGPRR